MIYMFLLRCARQSSSSSQWPNFSPCVYLSLFAAVYEIPRPKKVVLKKASPKKLRLKSVVEYSGLDLVKGY